MLMKDKKDNQRDQVIIRTSIIGILANVFLAAFKVVAGLLSHSIAIVLDAVNNLSDAVSSVITIIGVKLAGKLPDHKHPYGYGRIEYLSATIISVIVLYAGITSLIESFKAIIHPAKPNYSTVILVIVGAAVVVKLVLGSYVKSVGEQVNSDSLIASGADASLDAVISASTLVAALLYLTVHISVEAYLGVIISIVIIKSGIEMLQDTLSDILGERVDLQIAHQVKKTVSRHKYVRGAYDLTLHNYGPDIYRGSIHVEVPDTLTADEIDTMTREIQKNVLEQHNVILDTVGVYSYNTSNDSYKKIRSQITEVVMKHDEVIQMHGFYINDELMRIQFDIIIEFSCPHPQKIYRTIMEDVQKLYPEYEIIIALDADISD